MPPFRGGPLPASWQVSPAPRGCTRALDAHIACGVIEISSLQELLPFVKSQRIPQNVRPIFSKLWHMFVTVPSHNVSERRNLNNPRLNAVQSGAMASARPSSHRESHLPQGTARTRCEREKLCEMLSAIQTLVPSCMSSPQKVRNDIPDDTDSPTQLLTVYCHVLLLAQEHQTAAEAEKDDEGAPEAVVAP